MHWSVHASGLLKEHPHCWGHEGEHGELCAEENKTVEKVDNKIGLIRFLQCKQSALCVCLRGISIE